MTTPPTETRVVSGSYAPPASLIITPATSDAPRSWFARSALAESATQLRDFALVLAAAAYVLGYLSWALFAWAYELGPVPALYADYVMTGLFPLAIIAALLPVGRGIRSATAWTRGEPSEGQAKLGKFLTAVGTASILLSLPIKFLGDTAYSFAIGASIAAMLIGAIVSRGAGDKFLKRMVVALVWYAAIVGALIGLVAYWDKVFAAWPQQLGGPRPRCVVFDADAAQLSAETRGVLFGPAADSVGKHRTLSLYTIFAGGDFVLVKRDATPLHKREPVYRIPKSALGAESPCPRL